MAHLGHRLSAHEETVMTHADDRQNSATKPAVGNPANVAL